MRLNLGVIDVPEPEGDTTYIVACDLEKRYGLYNAFADSNAQFIAAQLGKSLNNQITALMQGQKISKPFEAAGDAITDRFKQFISQSEVERLGIPGVPTLAAQEGLTLRTKTGKRIGKHKQGAEYLLLQGEKRPSFQYSGVFEASIKCWVD